MAVHLGEVVFPLRYDVWAQARALKQLICLSQDPDELLVLGRETPICRGVALAIPVYQRMGKLPPLTEEQFEVRCERHYQANMRKLAACYVSISQGWDTSKPRLCYHRVQAPAVTTEGHTAPDGLFLTDGQHRTAVLLALGNTVLPDHVAGTLTVPGTEFFPLDVTHAYVEAGECAEQDFVEFARVRFDIPARIKDIRGLREWATQASALDWLARYIGIYWGES